MNILVFVADTFRADHLGCSGNPWISTPNLDGLARRGVRFTHAYAEGLPTICARRVFFTGRRLFPGWERRIEKGDPQLSRQPGWHSLAEADVTIAEILAEAGYTTGLISDTLHLFKPGRNFHRGFHSWQWIRGQENDAHRTGPRADVDLTPYVRPGQYQRRRFQGLEQYLLNNAGRRSEEDYLAPKVMTAAARWLRDNRDNTPFFLWVDCFDPHEPWDPPPGHADRYAPPVPGLEPIVPGVRADAYSAAELARIRALYAAEVTMVDTWIGRVLAEVDALGLADSTVVAFLGDHGTILGEHGRLRKQNDLLIAPTTRIPWIVRDPRADPRGVEVGAAVQAEDVMPTLLGLAGVPVPSQVQGADVWPLLQGAPSPHGRVVTAYGDFVSVRTGAWNYLRAYAGPHARGPRDPRPGGAAVPETVSGPGDLPALFDLTADPLETRNVIDAHPEVAADFEGYLQRCLAQGAGGRP